LISSAPPKSESPSACGELKPLVNEYHELEQVAQQLGLSLDEYATAPDERRPASGASAQGRSASAGQAVVRDATAAV
jgi:hypothetical protein